MSHFGAKPRRSIPGNLPSFSVPPPNSLVNGPYSDKSWMAGSTVWWKTILVPPFIALAIYLIIVYTILPLYRQRARYSQYIPISLPLSSSNTGEQSFVSRARDRVLDALSPFVIGNGWRRRGSRTSVDSMFGDEELEEGTGIGEIVIANRRNSGAEEDRRLSRELEVGFRDDSDEEDLDIRTAELQGSNNRRHARS